MNEVNSEQSPHGNRKPPQNHSSQIKVQGMRAFLAAVTQKVIEDNESVLTTVNFESLCRGQHLLAE